MADYIISDTHFYHANIIRYCNRPYANTYEMNKALIENWNSIVQPDDRVFHLGDFAFAPMEQIEEIVRQLNGYIILIMGNHDKKSVSKFLSMGFAEVHKKPITMGNYILSHQPIENLSYDIINIHGHTHNTYFKQYDNEQYINVSAEVIGYKPIRLDSIMEGV